MEEIKPAFEKAFIDDVTLTGLRILLDENNKAPLGKENAVQSLRAILAGLNKGEYLLVKVQEEAAPEDTG